LEIIQEITHPLFTEKKVQVHVLRLDVLQPEIGGNKYFKLKYNLEQARLGNHSTLLSFGGAYSNHIAALANAGKIYGFKTIGVIRGEELEIKSNKTLLQASKNGMQLHFINRELYRNKNDTNFIETLHQKFGNFYLIPEGGSNTLAVKGCKEIINLIPFHADYICCAVGTGGTITGIHLSSENNQNIIGIPVIKNATFLVDDIQSLKQQYNYQISNEVPNGKLELIFDYHFGGYAKSTKELLQFKATFQNEFQIPLDKIYTAKLFYAIFDLIKKDFFQVGQKIILVHTGGLQGN
jgi:1-aminocyclopropane-1-carboxylate deaminase/D-cysteine desulfhydrase-like pyridoxal-dependent ACC family enzyme